MVNEIASVEIAGKLRRNYSFATKYCSFHAPGAYPKCDGNTESIIWAYQESYGFGQFTQPELKDYPKYKATVVQFRSHFALSDFSFKQLDNFLWGYGREWKEGGE